MGNKNIESSTAQGLSNERSESPNTGESYIRLTLKRLIGAGVRKDAVAVFGDRFRRMYELDRDTHEHFELQEEGDVPFPSLEQVCESFTREELIFARGYQEPSLVLTPPGKSHDDLFLLLSARYGLGRQPGPRISDAGSLRAIFQDDYQSFIVEGASRMKTYGDRRSSPLASRCKRQAGNREDCEKGMNGNIYAMLAMQSVVRGDLIDQHNYTILDGEGIVGSSENRYVPVGHCLPDKPMMEWLPSADASRTRARFRRVIGGRFIEPGL